MGVLSLTRLIPSGVSLIGFLVIVSVFLPNQVNASDSSVDKRIGRDSRSIVNGSDIGPDVWPAVVRLSMTMTHPTDPTVKSSGRLCTGTLLARDTIKTARDLGTSRGDVVLTAAHCFNPDDDGRVVARITYWRDSTTQGQTATNWVQNSQYIPNGNKAYDTGLIFFASRNGFTNGLPICEQAPHNGDQITLVGFGCNNFASVDGTCTDGTGTKRQGINTIDNDGDIIKYTGPIRDHDGSEQSQASGDSGGPYIVTQEGGPCIAGVVSGGEITDTNKNGKPDNGDTRLCYGANLHNVSSQAFLTAQLPGLDCDIYGVNCDVRYATLYREFYGKQPDAGAVSQNIEDLKYNRSTLHEIAEDIRSDLFSKVQPALTMLLDIQ